MAATAAAAQLTEAHRLAQARVGARTVRDMLAVWRLLDLDDLDGSFERWLSAAAAVIAGRRRTSAVTAAGYLTAFRALELGFAGDPFTPTLADLPDTRRVTTSMLVTGPIAIRSGLGRGVPLAKAADIARLSSARSAMRHALGGGRDTIAATVANDRAAIGWARATSGRACAFCAMLASRGPVYSAEGVDFAAHDGCSCTAEPVYRSDADWPAGARQYRDLWDESDGDLNSFRQTLADR